MATDREVFLTAEQRSEVSSIAQSRCLPAGYVFRAKLVLMLAEGASFNTIKRSCKLVLPRSSAGNSASSNRGSARYLSFRSEGHSCNSGVASSDFVGNAEETYERSTHWSCRKLAAALGVSKDAVHRVWKQAGKIAIQTLDRLDPVLPLSPGRAERHGFEYYRQNCVRSRD